MVVRGMGRIALPAPLESAGLERALGMAQVGECAPGERQADEVLRIQRDAAAEVVSAPDLRAAVDAVLDALVALPSIDAVGLYVVDEERGSLELSAYRGVSLGFAAEVARFGPDSRQALMVFEGRPVYSAYGSSDGDVSAAAARAEGLTALGIVPILHEGRATAALSMASRTAGVLTDEARTACETIAALVGGTIARLAAEDAHRASERNLQSLFDTVEDLLFVLDEHGTILHANRAAESRLGYPASEMRGWSALLVHPPRLREEAARVLTAILRGEASVCPVPLQARDGTEIVVETRVVRGQWDGRAAFFGVSRDIADRLRAEEERRRLEEQLRLSQKMEALGQLAGGIAHDFNNILQVVSTSSEAALASIAAGGTPDEDIADVLEATRRAAALVEQLLAFGSRQSVRLDTLDLDATVAEVSAMLSRVLGGHIELAYVPRNGRCHARADRGQVEQVLLNLALNARDAMPSGGRLTIETDECVADRHLAQDHPDAVEGARYAVVSILDTGVGIPAEVRPRIFEPFFTTKEAGKGTGLGLATVYGLVRQHAGFVAVESPPEGGARFRVYLPAAEGRASLAPRRRAGAEPPRGRGECILVVEDDELVRRVAVSALQRNGYRTLAAASGEEASRLFDERREAINLAFIDVMMPGQNGLAVRDYLRAAEPGLPVLFTSGCSSPVAHHAPSPAEGPTDLLPKPYTVGALLWRLRLLLDAATPSHGPRS
jgi:two-component system, cell cycle sensor histidine kinase and response regulator CckA